MKRAQQQNCARNSLWIVIHCYSSRCHAAIMAETAVILIDTHTQRHIIGVWFCSNNGISNRKWTRKMEPKQTHTHTYTGWQLLIKRPYTTFNVDGSIVGANDKDRSQKPSHKWIADSRNWVRVLPLKYSVHKTHFRTISLPQPIRSQSKRKHCNLEYLSGIVGAHG